VERRARYNRILSSCPLFTPAFRFLRVEDGNRSASSRHGLNDEVRVVRFASGKMHEHMNVEGKKTPENRQNDGCCEMASRCRLGSRDDKGRSHQNAKDPGKEASVEVRRGHRRRPGGLSECGRHHEASDDAKGENGKHPPRRAAGTQIHRGRSVLFSFPVSSANDFMARFPRTRTHTG
jgi:hypothetical protein